MAFLPIKAQKKILEQYLWMYFSYHQDDWNTWLPLADFSHNNPYNSSTKQSPFFKLYGRNPQFDSAHITQDTPAGKSSRNPISKERCQERTSSLNRQFQELAPIPPSQWKSTHPVFHVSLLEPVKTSTIPNWHQEPPPPIIIEEEEGLEVSQILDLKLKIGKL
ncbi:hypothetical protein O181_082998 [Austropuccinia psidii MF-1]|uniref:Chromo domain-containing protein n=1 Tax=Austropuccinia psidii MF-1 TaxID=1389203 RepID=A0A9Q3FSV2_9BASI|nr:hypothetical protein [Austropuccinia psidii MF-1]